MDIICKTYIYSVPTCRKGGHLRIFSLNIDFEDVQSNWFTLVRFNLSIISMLSTQALCLKKTKKYGVRCVCLFIISRVDQYWTISIAIRNCQMFTIVVICEILR